jgi:glycine/D-amino acid oxidase-like deaminating enzyme
MRICIVGGGAIRAVASRYLADKGHSVTLVEQDNKLCARTSGGNASLLCFDGSISIFRERADWKSMLTIATRYPRWAANYLFSFPKEHTFIERQRKLLDESAKIFHDMVPSDYNYGKLVTYSDGSIKPNSYQVYTPDFINRLVIHPNISIKFNSFVTDIVTDGLRVTAIKTASGETIHADVFVLCRNTNEGPIMIAPVYGQTHVRKSDKSPCAIIDNATHIVYNVIDGKERVSHGAIVRTNVDDAIRDLHIHEIDGSWDEILTNARPVSPDSLPIICKDKKLTNLFYSGGHGFIGWSLSFISAKILDDVINGKTTEFTDWVGDRFF